MPVPLTFIWKDNNGKKAETRFWMPDTVTLDNVNAWPSHLETAMLLVSDARIERAEVRWNFPLSLNTTAGPNSDVSRILMLFYRNEGDPAAVSLVPSPGALPLDTVGAYRGVRLGLAAATVSGLLPDLERIADGTLTPGGTAWPGAFRVGGVTRQEEA